MREGEEKRFHTTTTATTYSVEIILMCIHMFMTVLYCI